MPTMVDADDLIASDEVAAIIGLSNPKGVSVIRSRRGDFPTPKIERGRCLLWLRSEVEAWANGRVP